MIPGSMKKSSRINRLPNLENRRPLPSSLLSLSKTTKSSNQQLAIRHLFL
jgi:hypothetical protein